MTNYESLLRVRAALAQAEGRWSNVERLYDVLIAAELTTWAQLGEVPPDACVAYYGPGPCREHGSTVAGSTDAVAGPPPDIWHGRVQAPGAKP